MMTSSSFCGNGIFQGGIVRKPQSSLTVDCLVITMCFSLSISDEEEKCHGHRL